VILLPEDLSMPFIRLSTGGESKAGKEKGPFKIVMAQLFYGSGCSNPISASLAAPRAALAHAFYNMLRSGAINFF